MAFDILGEGESGTVIKVIGVGGAGGNALNNMIRHTIKGNVEYIAANTDRQALSLSQAEKIIQLGSSGLGAGARPEIGAHAANEAREEIATALQGADMVFIAAGMGGGTGTGAAPIVADVSRELGILTVAVVTKPFSFEGNRRMRNAEEGLAALKNRVHALIVILNDKLEEELGEDATVKECFEKADEVLYNACSGIAELIHSAGVVNADFQDVRTVMSELGTAMMGAAEAEGPDRAITAAAGAIECPLLEGVNLKGARALLVNITAKEDNLRQSEVRRALETIRNFADQDANVIHGIVYDETMGDRMRIVVIATGLDQTGTNSNLNTPVKPPYVRDTNGVWTPITPQSWQPTQGSGNTKPAEIGTDLFGQPQPQSATRWGATANKTVVENRNQPTTNTPSAQPSASAMGRVEAIQEPAVTKVTKPYVEAVAPSCPISQPDENSTVNIVRDNTVFGNIPPVTRPEKAKSVDDIFAILGNRNQGSGMWTSNAQHEVKAPQEQQDNHKKSESEFSINIPPFLRKSNN